MSVVVYGRRIRGVRTARTLPETSPQSGEALVASRGPWRLSGGQLPFVGALFVVGQAAASCAR